MTRDEIEAQIVQMKEIKSRGDDVFSYSAWVQPLVTYIEQLHKRDRDIETPIADYLLNETEVMSASTAYIVQRLAKDVREGKYRK